MRHTFRLSLILAAATIALVPSPAPAQLVGPVHTLPGLHANGFIPQPPKLMPDGSTCSRSTPCRITINKGYGYNGLRTGTGNRGFNGYGNGRNGFIHSSAIAIQHIK